MSSSLGKITLMFVVANILGIGLHGALFGLFKIKLPLFWSLNLGWILASCWNNLFRKH